jgi:hypothetical protein
MQYAGPPKESSDVALGHKTAAASEGIDARAHQILARKTPSKLQRIPPPRQET